MRAHDSQPVEPGRPGETLGAGTPAETTSVSHGCTSGPGLGRPHKQCSSVQPLAGGLTLAPPGLRWLDTARSRLSIGATIGRVAYRLSPMSPGASGARTFLHLLLCLCLPRSTLFN